MTSTAARWRIAQGLVALTTAFGAAAGAGAGVAAAGGATIGAGAGAAACTAGTPHCRQLLGPMPKSIGSRNSSSSRIRPRIRCQRL